jgi:mannose-6-phosphate isomerase-like protein (cupin superfamily)
MLKGQHLEEMPMNVVKRDEVPVFQGGPGEVVRELAGLARTNAQHLSLAEVIIAPGGRARDHYHHQMEEVYYILRGQAQLTVDDETSTVGPGDTIVIAPGAHHKIVNGGDTDVVMVVACAPAWHEYDNVFLE